MSAALLAHPEWWEPLLGIWLAALAGVALARLAARRRRRRLGPGIRPGVGLTRDAALLLGLACIGVALLGPRVGERTVLAPGGGVDVVLLLDASRSMRARDVPPSRLARARRAAQELLARLAPGDRAALAAFAGRGVLLTPLTPDRDALAELLGVLEAGLIEPGGSDLGAGVRAALEAFEMGSRRPRVLFVLSDGEDPERRGSVGAGEAVRREARVLAAALGTEGGALLGDGSGPLRDAEGRPVVSRRQVDRLERLAAATGGVVFRGDAWGGFDLDAAAREIRRDAGRAPGEPVARRVRAAPVAPLAALAFVLLAAEGLPLRRARRVAPRPRTARSSPAAPVRTAVALLAAAGLLAATRPAPGDPPDPLEDRLRDRPGDPHLLLELGLARLARGRHAAADRAFLAAALGARDPSLAALAYYDLGVSALERGDPAAARDAFFDALALDPESREARFNLEWTLRVLEDRPQAPPPPAPERETPPPRPAPEETPAAEPEPPPAPRPLDEQQHRRWLERVRDDPSLALRSWAGAGGAALRRSRRPAW